MQCGCSGRMTYYDELGLRPDATVDQIHVAYRNLVRLLHHDQQADETLRRLAEGQMKRLNTMHQVLVDPGRRRLYDAGLSNTPTALVRTAPPPPRAAWRPRGRDVCLVLIGSVLASAFWLSGYSSAGREEGAGMAATKARPLSQVPTAVSPSPRPLKRLVAAPQTAAAVASDVVADTLGPPALAAPVPAPEAPQPYNRPEADLPSLVASPVVTPMRPSSPEANVRVPSRFAGTWLYVRPQIPSPVTSLYLAEYVEAVIVDEGDRIRGRYRARYRVPDRPISPEVVFVFEGRAERETASLQWSGAGAAKGDVKLRLVSRNSMELEWIATELGSQMGLASGNATLTRWQER